MLSELLSYPFIVRALVVGTLVALCAALLGVSLVLKRYSMIGDGLSHVGFGALSIALAMNLAPLEVSLPVVALAAFLLLRLSERSLIRGDAAIALVSSSAIAIGVIVVSLSTGMNVDVYNLFGSILAMSESDVILSAAVSAVVLVLYVLFYNRIFAVTFDEGFAQATGTNAGVQHTDCAFDRAGDCGGHDGRDADIQPHHILRSPRCAFSNRSGRGGVRGNRFVPLCGGIDIVRARRRWARIVVTNLAVLGVSRCWAAPSGGHEI